MNTTMARIPAAPRAGSGLDSFGIGMRCTLAAALLALSPHALAGDRQIGVDPQVAVSWGFLTGGSTAPVKPTNGISAGFWQRSSGAAPGVGANFVGTAEFQLPETPPTRIRSATLQFKGRATQCAGSEPVVIAVYGYAGDGRADLSDASSGARITQLSADCKDNPAFTQPIDVTQIVRQLSVPSGVRHVGFNVRKGNNRALASLFGFSGAKLTVVVADEDVAVVSPQGVAGASAASAGDASPQARGSNLLGGLLGAAGTLLRGGGSDAAAAQARNEAAAALQGAATEAATSAAPSSAAPAAAALPTAATNPGGAGTMAATATAVMASTASAPAASAPAVGAPPAAATIDADIVGLRLGMSLAEVKRALQAHSQAMVISEQYGIVNNVAATKYLSWIIARAPRGAPAGSSDAIGVHFPPPPNEHRAVFIERFTGFQNNELPLYDTIRDALTKKFGQPSFANEGMMLWTYNASGTQIVESSTMGRCAKFAPIDPPARGQNVLFNGYRTQNCGVTIYARYERGRGPADRDLTRYVSVSIIDDTQFEAMRQATASFASQVTRETASRVAAPKF